MCSSGLLRTKSDPFPSSVMDMYPEAAPESFTSTCRHVLCCFIVMVVVVAAAF